jgi:hypothetical protein
MSRMKTFSATNPTGDTPGMEPVRLDVLRAAVQNTPPQTGEPVTTPAPPQPPVATPAPAAVQLINKNIRLPADLVDFVDFVYTKERRLKKQDAYTEALEAFFRPLMKPNGKPDAS